MIKPLSVCPSVSSTSQNQHTEPLMSSWKRRKAEEREEEEEINEFFRIENKSWRKESEAAKIAYDVEKMMAELEMAAEDDAQLNWLGTPAVNKLKELSNLANVLSKKQLQHEFLDHGVLSLLKNWLEPLPDGSLPNVDVRAAVLKILDDLPIDVKLYDRREQYKRSGLKKVIMFLSKSDEETTTNRILAKKLADKWFRSTFNKSTRFEDRKLFEEERVLRPPPVKKGSKSGESSSSQHASRPEPVSIDFVVRPPSKVDPVAARVQAKQMARDQPHAKLNKKLQQMRASKRRQLQAVKVNALGRGMANYL